MNYLVLSFLQTQTTEVVVRNENYFDILLKGGWILVPIILLSFLAIYIMGERWYTLKRLGGKDSQWLKKALDLTKEGKVNDAITACTASQQASGMVIAAGLRNIHSDIEVIQEEMEVESRQQISKLESNMNILGITASIAPMLGFLGTIFGVIKIFYTISLTNDLSIGSISAGLYQKMICSGAGLLVGIIAYAAYHYLNGQIDRIVVRMDKEGNQFMRVVRALKPKK